MSCLYIGFGHRSGVGKDTCAKLLDINLRIKKPGLRIRKISMADKLKDVAYQVYRWTGIHPPLDYETNRELRNEIIPELNCTMVDLWVMLGEKFREIHAETWLDYLFETDHAHDIVICPDVRHFNELSRFNQNGNRAYKVTNSRVPRREGKSIDDILEGVTDWTDQIENEGSLKELNVKMAAIADEILKERFT